MFLRKCRIASLDVALVGPFPRVCAYVVGKTTFLRKCRIASLNVALVGLITALLAAIASTSKVVLLSPLCRRLDRLYNGVQAAHATHAISLPIAGENGTWPLP